ncbi:2-hydroxyacid dehydrogenase [Alcaligenes faecalis]|jgi:lactate dehydrogenase-like 2-hydroxyacid dehydrogenase|uniref:2-hydroxyacid dehydrogenase n=1 Tax=Alcaligenes faecalis TaxID=511 RepID=A0ABY7N205_ALCFA|nr:2-hydroxyacid dehydrogenase [Alcaligenes faecalis]WBM37985.1 2-hydroxyacid dehydrogenase [Alcaligenes faecalis]
MTMNQKILQACPLPPPLAGKLPALCPVEILSDASDQTAFLREHDDEFTVLITTGTHGADKALIDALPNLKAICSLGVGYDAIDLDAVRARGVMLSNTPDVLNDCVADLAIGLLIDAVRGISASDRHVRRGDWPRVGPTMPSTRVSGKRLGMLGMGRVGQVIARRAVGFDMDIRYHTRSPNPQLPWHHEPSLLTLAQWCDFLVVACPGSPETYHLVSAEVLKALGPNGYLVNVARGSVVDEKALVAALENGQLGGAGLDVFENEPEVPAELLRNERVVVLPHVGSATRETRAAMCELVLRNVERFVTKGGLVTPVNL